VEKTKKTRKRYYDLNRKHLLSNMKIWSVANLDIIKERLTANQEERLEKRRKYRAAHLEEEHERGKKYYIANRKSIREKQKVAYHLKKRVK